MKEAVLLLMKWRLPPTPNEASYYCGKERKACVGWVEKYFKDCLCNWRDELSFGFGLVSLVAWGVAEVPQIITNFRTKSSHGVSLIFLLTWVIGDIFNLVGCLLEPATLPTQYYTALLYTVSTVLLVLQGLYYDHLYRWWRRRRKLHDDKAAAHDQQVGAEETKPLKPKSPDDEPGVPIPGALIRSPARRREYYYMSARSLAGSDTPPFRSYLRGARSGPSAMVLDGHSSSEDEADPAYMNKQAASRPNRIPRAAAQVAVMAASVNLPLRGNALLQAYVGFTGRKLLQENDFEHSPFGQWLGWLMAAIYMGGRLPQIVLNIKRGSVEGLNPLMFVFALAANVAYVGSILVRSVEWDKIKANMPWLLDAVACVLLDSFIILQYVYYKYLRNRKPSEDEEEDYYYAYADKAVGL